MLTNDQERLIAATAPLVADHLDAITQHFYPLMFRRYPDVRPLFNEAHQADGGQPRALAGSVLAYVQLRQDRTRAREVLATVVSKHVSLGIRPDQYPIVGECLMAAIGEVLGEAVTPEIAAAWSALYEELAGLLIELEDQRYHQFASREGGWRGTRRFRIAETRQESAVIRSFVLVPEDGGRWPISSPVSTLACAWRSTVSRSTATTASRPRPTAVAIACRSSAKMAGGSVVTFMIGWHWAIPWSCCRPVAI